MTAESIVCRTCATEVPYGRLSCPSCGELLASVAGSRRAAARAGGRSPLPDVLYDQVAAPSAAVTDGEVSIDPPSRDLDSELPWVTSTTHGAGEVLEDAALPAPADADDDDGPDPGDLDGEPSSTAAPEWAVGGMGLTGSPTPAYLPRPAVGTGAAAARSFAGPGAYVPPPPVVVVPAGPPAPARAWAGRGPDALHVADSDVSGVPAASSAARADRIDGRARLAEFIGWLSVAGAAFSAVGFLLPWGMTMIGSPGVEYFDRWGLAGPGHLIVALGVLAILALALIKNDIPIWIRTGLTSLGLGALLLGLVWPYVLGLPGTGPGAQIVTVGALALTISGLLALITDRHAEDRRSV